MVVVYCCIDVEASGPVPGLNDLVSLGAVAVRKARGGGHVALSPPLYLEFAPQGGHQDPTAMAVHGISDAHLRAHGVSVPDGLAALTRWAEDHRGSTGDGLVFVGHNAPFDWAYVNHAYHRAGLSNPFGWKALDTKALAMGVLDVEWLATNKENLAKLLPAIGVEDAAHVHRADHDAEYQARILCALLDHPRRRRAEG